MTCVRKKALSSALGVLLAVIITLPLILGYVAYLRKNTDVYVRYIKSYTEKLEVRPYINATGVYAEITNVGSEEPTVLSYVILKNVTNGQVLWIKHIGETLNVGQGITIQLFNTTQITGRYDIIAITRNGGVFHFDPEYIGNDGVLDEGDIQRIIELQYQNIISQLQSYLNPAVGWTLNKTVIIKKDGIVHYLIPFTVYSNRTAQYVFFSDSSLSYSVTATLYDADVNKYVDYIQIYWGYYSSGARIYYTDGTVRALSGAKTYTTNIYANITYTYTTPNYTIDLRVYFKIPEITIVDANDMVFLFSGNYTAKITFTNIRPSNTSVWIILGYTVSDTSATTRFSSMNIEPVTQTIANVSNGVSVVLSDTIGARIDFGLNNVGDTWNIISGSLVFSLYRIQILLTVPAYEPVLASLNEPYYSYDTYQLDITKIYPCGKVYVRNGNDTYYIDYDDTVFPGFGNLRINALMPFMYALNITQGASLPPYLILITPKPDITKIASITGTYNNYLVGLGLVNKTTIITLKYDAVIYTARYRKYYFRWTPFGVYTYWFTYYSADSNVTVGSSMILVPLNGVYMGQEFYVWSSDEWLLLKILG